MGALSCRPVARGCALALPVAIADRPLLRRCRLDAHRRGGPSGGERGQPLFNTPCAENDGVPAQLQTNVEILGPDNQPTKYSPGSGNACAPTPWGAVERTFINALTTSGESQTVTTTR